VDKVTKDAEIYSGADSVTDRRPLQIRHSRVDEHLYDVGMRMTSGKYCVKVLV
jgi:hypothetical protein